MDEDGESDEMEMFYDEDWPHTASFVDGNGVFFIYSSEQNHVACGDLSLEKLELLELSESPQMSSMAALGHIPYAGQDLINLAVFEDLSRQIFTFLEKVG